MVLVVIYSCFIYPIDLQEFEFDLIAKQTNLEVDYFALPRDISFKIKFWFFNFDLAYNQIEF